jgi:hypothetical protein
MCVQDIWGPANYRLAREMLLLNHGICFRTLASYGAAEAIANAALLAQSCVQTEDR